MLRDHSKSTSGIQINICVVYCTLEGQQMLVITQIFTDLQLLARQMVEPYMAFRYPKQTLCSLVLADMRFFIGCSYFSYCICLLFQSFFNILYKFCLLFSIIIFFYFRASLFTSLYLVTS